METNNYQVFEDRLLRASEVAEKLNISRSLAYKLLQCGEIPTVRIYKSVRVKQSDVDEYIRRQWSGWNESL
jgi:excisionase family DNA binding protein